MRVTMLGSGYVGLVSGACLSDFGHDVTCVDTDAGKIDALKAGAVPIYEPGLADLLARNMRAGRLSFTTDLASGADADAIFIAVGTPARHGDGYANVDFVHAAARAIAEVIRGFTVVVTKSTVPVGTSDVVEAIIRERRPDARFAVVSNPEFLREGAAIEDFKRPDRIVIGVDDARARAVMGELYRPMLLNEAQMVFTDRRTSELIKYAANAFLAMKITFINEVADLCERVGADVGDLARGIGLDARIGTRFLYPGPGYGGSCFPKDTLALIRTAADAGSPVRLVETVVAVNESRKSRMAEKIVAACGGAVAGKRIAVLGLTFKSNTDDMRDAPSLVIVPALAAAGADLVAYDPQGMEAARAALPGLALAADPYAAVRGADALVILTEWDAFRALDLGRVRGLMRTPVIVDLRNLYAADEMARAGFSYVSLGRGAVARARSA